MRRIADQIQAPAVVRQLSEVTTPAARLRDHDLAESHVRGYSDETVDRIYQALAHVTFFLPEQRRYVELQRRVITEKARRGTRTAADIRDLYRAYVGARMFQEARELRSELPNERFPAVPETIISSSGPTTAPWRAFDVSEGGDSAKLIKLPLVHGTKVVMVMWPGCAVAERAATAILKDEEFAERFRANALLLTERFDSVGVQMWKEHFGLRDVYIANRASEFPGLDFLASPRFFFLKDGTVVFSFQGWSNREDSKARASLRHGMDVLGL